MHIGLFMQNSHCGGVDTFVATLVNNWPFPADEWTLIGNRSHPGLAVIERLLDRPCRVIRHRVPVDTDVFAVHKGIFRVPFVGRVASFITRYGLFLYQIAALFFFNAPAAA